MPIASQQMGKEHPHPPKNECPGYDTKPSDGDAPVLVLLGIGSSP